MDLVVVLVVLVAAGAVVGAAAWWAHQRRQKADSAFETAAKELGLEYFAGTAPGFMRGTLNGVEISGRPSGPRQDGYSLRIAGMPATVSIAPEHITLASDIRTGDDAFDAALRILGEESAARALSDAETRDVLLRTLSPYRGAMRMQGGELTLEYQSQPQEATRIVRDARALAAVAVAITAHYPVDGRVRCLARISMEDPIPAVRRRCLESLVEHHRDDPASMPAFEAVLASDNPELRLLGAIGARRTDLLRELVASGYPAAPRARALRELLALLPREDAEREALAALLDADEASDVMQAAVEVLAAVGTPKAVEALRAHAGVLTALGRTASAAIDAIQGRLVGAEPGQLAMSDDPAAGAVSMPSADAGAVSLPAVAKKQST